MCNEQVVSSTLNPLCIYLIKLCRHLDHRVKYAYYKKIPISFLFCDFGLFELIILNIVIKRNSSINAA